MEITQQNLEANIKMTVQDEIMNKDQFNTIVEIGEGRMTVKGRLITPEYMCKVFGVNLNTLIEAGYASKNDEKFRWVNMNPERKVHMVAFIMGHREEAGGAYRPVALYGTEEERQHILDIVEDLKKVEGYNSEYADDGRVDIGIVMKDDKMSNYVKEYIAGHGFYAESVYNDSCGKSGGHHKYESYTVKAYDLVQTLNQIVNAELNAFRWK